MIFGVVVLVFFAAITVSYFILSRKHKSNFLALAEYWVYLPEAKMPPQDDIMALMIQTNPYTRRGVSPIGPKEGLVFSDVRLHVALVLRSKNPHIFRPDLFEEHIKATDEVLKALADAKSLVKLRYVSESPLADKRHLQFLVHASDAVAELGKGIVIFDVKAERLLLRSQLQQELRENFDATVWGIHTNIVWKKSVRGGIAETRGLTKIGVSELKTGELETDQQVIATNVLGEAVKSIWELGNLPTSLDVSIFDDTFTIQVEKDKDAVADVKILRVQAI